MEYWVFFNTHLSGKLNNMKLNWAGFGYTRIYNLHFFLMSNEERKRRSYTTLFTMIFICAMILSFEVFLILHVQFTKFPIFLV